MFAVDKDEFHAALRKYFHAQPFAPFAIELGDGRRLVIETPRLVFSDGAASYIDPEDGALVDFFCEQVESIGPVKQEAKA